MFSKIEELCILFRLEIPEEERKIIADKLHNQNKPCVIKTEDGTKFEKVSNNEKKIRLYS